MPAVRVVLDACVLYDAAVQDLLLRLGLAGHIEPIWSTRILDECFVAFARTRTDLTEDQLQRLRAAISRAFPRAAVAAGQSAVELPDADDVHVVGTALAAHAEVIVTYNITDFPAHALEPLGLRAEHPDALTHTLLEADPDAVLGLLREHARALRKPPTTVERLLATLEARGLRRFAAAARVELARRG
ncbi:MAG: PIN domain-containing protein [Pseudomonadota bacterium]|nr:PIN domain-containing protein [Pseudomonadota bacterium]